MAAASAVPLVALFSTGNEGKFWETEAVLRTLCPTLRLLRCEVEPDELQGSCSAIATAKTREALALARVAHAELLAQASFFFTEDVSLHLSCLGGFPGPYVKDFLEAVGEDGVYDCVKRFENHRAHALCSLAVVDLRCTPVRNPVVYTGRLDGTIVAPRGDVRHGKRSWNSSFLPVGCKLTFGEMSYEEQALMSHRFRAHEAAAVALFNA